MNIKKVEEGTGITKQNIRFYEKHELVSPSRNKENEYREYTQDDVRSLKIVKILRKLDMPIEEIKSVLEKKIPLSKAIKEHQEKLQKQERQLQAAIDFCKILKNDSVDVMDPDLRLREMEEHEERGMVFMSLIKDIVEMEKEEKEIKFCFSPNIPIRNKAEFTQELCKYATENNLNMIITKESMYPEFEIDGLEYEAHRMISWFGAVVECTVKSEERTNEEQKQPKKGKILRFLIRTWPFLLLGFCLFFTRMIGNTTRENVIAVAAFTLIVCSIGGYCLRFMLRKVG